MCFLAVFGDMQLSRKVVDMRELRKIASQGIPDGPGIRSAVWKVSCTTSFSLLFLLYFLRKIVVLDRKMLYSSFVCCSSWF